MVKSNQRTKMINVFGSIIMLISVMFLFQNCGGLTEEEKDLTSLAADMPFAYDAVMDHIAYMSVATPKNVANDNTFFTFRAGAFHLGSGMKLRPEFSYQARNLIQSERAEVLTLSPANRNTYLQLSIRDTASPGTILSVGGNAVFGNFVGNLSSNPISMDLTKLNGSSRAISLGGAPLIGSLKAFQSETVASSIRNDLSSGAQTLTLVYGIAGQPAKEARNYTKAGDATSRYYGRGYGVGFTRGHGINLSTGQTNAFTSGANHVMNQIIEGAEDLYSSASIEWNCPSNWSFIIVRKTEAVGTLCTNWDVEPSPTSADPNYSAYMALRKLLPSAEWGVNLTQRCIVPKNASLDPYSGVAAQGINYQGGSCDATGTNCPHYVTICKRN
jgi:hypothetical protein